MKYCRYCGLEMNITPTGFFDQDTGKPTMKYACMNKKCKGFCDIFGHNYKKTLFSWLFTTKCKNCGKYEPGF
jgi:hypothetical protein